MKKVKLMLVSLLTVIISLFCLVGCGTAGTYKFKSMTTSSLGGLVSTTINAGQEYGGVVISENFITLTLNSDNTFTMTMLEDSTDSSSESSTGTWSEKDGVLTLTVGDGNMNCTLKDGEISLIMDTFLGEATVTLKK